MTFSCARLTCPALAWRSYLGEQQVERAGDLADRLDGDTGIERRGVELLVPEQHLNDSDVGLPFEQMRGEAMAQGVNPPTRLSIPARCAAAWTARLSCRVVRGSPGTWPGNSQYRGLAIRHHCRDRSSSCCDNIT